MNVKFSLILDRNFIKRKLTTYYRGCTNYKSTLQFFNPNHRVTETKSEIK